MADAVILLALALAVLWGLQRGLIRPLLSEFAFLVALLLSVRFHLDSLLWGFVPRFAAALVMTALLSIGIGLVLRPLASRIVAIGPISKIDRPAGAAAHALIAFVVIYLVVGAILDFDTHVYPLLRTGLITAQQIDDYSKFVNQSPSLKPYVDQAQLQQARAAAQQQPIPVGALARVESLLNFYVRDIREPLLSSRLAPVVNRIGGTLPIVGHPRPYLPDAAAASGSGP